MARHRLEQRLVHDLRIRRRLSREQPDPATYDYLERLTQQLRSVGNGALTREFEAAYITYLETAEHTQRGSGTITAHRIRSYARQLIGEVGLSKHILPVDADRPLVWSGRDGNKLALNVVDTGYTSEVRGHLITHLHTAFGDLPELAPPQSHLVLGTIVIDSLLDTDPNELWQLGGVPERVAFGDWLIELNKVDGLPKRFR